MLKHKITPAVISSYWNKHFRWHIMYTLLEKPRVGDVSESVWLHACLKQTLLPHDDPFFQHPLCGSRLNSTPWPLPCPRARVLPSCCCPSSWVQLTCELCLASEKRLPTPGTKTSQEMKGTQDGKFPFASGRAWGVVSGFHCEKMTADYDANLSVSCCSLTSYH